MHASRIAVVTGGGALGDERGYGMGHAICRRLSRDGIVIAVLDMSQERAEETVREVRAGGGHAEAFVVDVTDRSSVSQAIDAVADRFGRIDILCNCVGRSGTRAPFVEQKEEMWESLIAVNFKSVLYCCHACTPYIVKQSEGRIVSISSDASKQGEEGQSVYAASKAAIAAFSKSLAKEVGPQGVTVNVISPGTTNNAALRDRLARPEFKGIASVWRARLATGRFVEPAEIAAAVAMLVAPDGRSITGQHISVNGGASMIG